MGEVVLAPEGSAVAAVRVGANAQHLDFIGPQVPPEVGELPMADGEFTPGPGCQEAKAMTARTG